MHKDGEIHRGTMHFVPPITLEVELQDDEVRKAVKGTVRSLLSHRMASTRSGSSKQETVAFAEEDHHPLGRRIILGDKYDSSYRIRDNRIFEVDRNMDGTRLLITVMESQQTRSAKSLPIHFFVTVFDKASGAINHAAAYRDAYQLIGANYLPRSREVVTALNGQTEVLLVEWEDLEVLSPRVSE